MNGTSAGSRDRGSGPGPAGAPRSMSTASTGGPDSDGWSPRLALLVAATFFMEFLDGTVLTTAIPSIANDFSVASAGREHHHDGLPHDGRDGNSAQRLARRTLRAPAGSSALAIAVFTVASLLCAREPGPHHADPEPCAARARAAP